jgi:hypothetical protein
MEAEGRNFDLRDSTMVRSSQANRKGRDFASQGNSEMSKAHVTPWGTNPDGRQQEPPKPMSPTRRNNHLQNQEALEPQGTYRVPDPSAAHNHMQNQQTQQGTDRLKMQSSRINDGNVAFGETKPGDYSGTTSVLQSADGDRVRLKVAPGCSRINSGHDIFGGPTAPPAKVGSKPYEEPFVDRQRTGHIRTPWLGYTDAPARK